MKKKQNTKKLKNLNLKKYVLINDMSMISHCSSFFLNNSFII